MTKRPGLEKQVRADESVALREQENILKVAWLDTKLGPMMAIADDDALYLLEFVDRRGLEREVGHLCKKIKSAITPGKTNPIYSIEKELNRYFDGQLSEFKTPICYIGSPFQKRVWEELIKIPFGETGSYALLAKAVGQPAAFRAVAMANGANRLAIVIPCHRVINKSGELGGYSGGLIRKKWLINHERKSLNKEILFKE